MIPLRGKVIFSLILMSFVSIALTALVARNLISQRFEMLSHDPVAENFTGDVTAYYQEYGSWRAAFDNEPLYEFVQRMRDSGELPQPTLYPGTRRPFVLGEVTGPPQRTQNIERGAETVAPPPPPYMLLDQDGVVLLSPAQQDIGRRLPENQIKASTPILVDGQPIGFIYSDLQAALGVQRNQYLTAIRNSLWISLLVGGLLSLPIGILLGRRLTGPIQILNQAMRSMQPGALGQKIPVTSQDELGHLTNSFNRMSSDLSEAYDELERSRKYMEEMSLQDPLTELPNRRSFDESAAVVLAQAYRHNRSCVLAMIDVDHFKKINDNYSHASGDLALKLLSKELKANLREVDIVARYGGEEFLILFPETDLQTAHELMDRLREHIAEHQWPEIDSELQITISAGLVEVDVRNTSSNPLETALNAADKKLYQAKSNGRNQTVS